MKFFENTVAFIAGVFSHICYFNRGEHHLYGARYIQIFCAVVSAGVVICYMEGQALTNAFACVIYIALFYLAGIYLSLLFYRLLLHPLNKFPGPLGARVSNLWFSAQLRNRDAFRKVQHLHERYGDFVRIGSSDLSITHPKAVSAIYGQRSKCTKAAWYDLTRPIESLQTLRIKALHDKRRRVWSTAFSDKALRGYEERIQKYRDKLIAQIETFDGRPINVSKWFNLYSFDIMGDLAFGASFNMLEASEEHWAIKLLNEGIEPLAYLFPIWFFRVLTAIPGLTRDWWRFIDYCAQRVDERRQVFHQYCMLPKSLTHYRRSQLSLTSCQRSLSL